jgi:hypothetical protein
MGPSGGRDSRCLLKKELIFACVRVRRRPCVSGCCACATFWVWFISPVAVPLCVPLCVCVCVGRAASVGGGLRVHWPVPSSNCSRRRIAIILLFAAPVSSFRPFSFLPFILVAKGYFRPPASCCPPAFVTTPNLSCCVPSLQLQQILAQPGHRRHLTAPRPPFL